MTRVSRSIVAVTHELRELLMLRYTLPATERLTGYLRTVFFAARA